MAWMSWLPLKTCFQKWALESLKLAFFSKVRLGESKVSRNHWKIGILAHQTSGLIQVVHLPIRASNTGSFRPKYTLGPGRDFLKQYTIQLSVRTLSHAAIHFVVLWIEPKRCLPKLTRVYRIRPICNKCVYVEHYLQFYIFRSLHKFSRTSYRFFSWHFMAFNHTCDKGGIVHTV